MPELASAYPLLQRGEYLAALEILDGCTPATPHDEAHALAWRAQALRGLGRPAEGTLLVIQAIRIIKAQGKIDELSSLRELHADLSRSVVHLELAEKARAEAQSVLAAGSQASTAEDYVRLAQAAAELGQRAQAEEKARAAIGLSVHIRERVLALLVLARVAGPDHLHAAHEIADDAGDANLVTAVAQTAKLLGVTLRPPAFG